MRDAAVRARTAGHAMITAVNRGLQIGLPFDASTADGVAPPAIAVAPTTIRLAPTGLGVAPVYFVRHRRARRYLLRVEPNGRLRVTIPRGGSKREAEAFALRNVGWVAEQRARLTKSATVTDETGLRAQAQHELPARIRELAAEHGVTGLARVSIRNQRTRWGSCGHGGHITLNWRLLLMPPSVRDYVLIHELMHLRRLDHSPAYWRLVAEACPWYTEARAWLRVNGRTLR
jgi:predicted metal-dependent hydrolase